MPRKRGKRSSEKAAAKNRRRTAERARIRRANETEEERNARLAKAAEQSRKRREKETPEQRMLRRAQSAERKRKRIANETKEQRMLRLAQSVEQKKKRIANETEEKRILRRVQSAEQKRIRIANETEEKRKLRLAKQVEDTRRRRLRNKETEEGRTLHLARRKEDNRQRRSKETEEQRILRRTQQAMYNRLRRSEHGQTTDTSDTLIEISRLKVWVQSLKKAALALIKNNVKITVEEITGTKGNDAEEKRRQKRWQRDKEHYPNETEEQRALRLQNRRLRDKLRYANEADKRQAAGSQRHISLPIEVIDNDSEVRANTKLFVCMVCKEEFSTKIRVITHLRYQHSGSEISKAIKAKKEALRAKKEKTSVKESSSLVQIHKCEICSGSFLAVRKFRAHLIQAHRDNKELLNKLCFPCSVCDEVFSSKVYLVQHHLDIHEIRIQCPICKEGIKTQDLFANHLIESHPDIYNANEMVLKYSGEYFCRICGFSSKRNYKATTHFQNKHSENKSFQCDICEQKFAFQRNLDRHKKIVHEQKLHCCEMCGKQFGREMDMIRHRKKHDKHYKKPTVECKECKKTFSCSASYRVHRLAIHKKQKPYQCTVCGKAFACQSTLYSHKTLVCEKDNAKPSACPICGKIVENYLVLVHHKANIHKYGNTEENVCHVCNKVFTGSSASASLYIHNNTYHKSSEELKAARLTKRTKVVKVTKQLKCEVCGNTFPSKKLLLCHWRIHREERPFKCSLCQVTFKQSSGFYLHKKTKHKYDQEDGELIVDLEVQEKLKEDFNKVHAIQFHNAELNEEWVTVVAPVLAEAESHETSNEINDANTTELEEGNLFDDNFFDFEEPVTDQVFEESNVSGKDESDTHIINTISTESGGENNEKSHCDLPPKENVPAASPGELTTVIQDIEYTEKSHPSSSGNIPACKNISTSFPEKLAAKEEDKTVSTKNLGYSTDGDELVNEYASLDLPCSDYPENELDLEDCKDLIEIIESTEELFPQDPFNVQLIVKLDKLKEYSCSLCVEVFYTSKLYKKHLNSRSHRSCLRLIPPKQNCKILSEVENDEEVTHKSSTKRKQKDKNELSASGEIKEEKKLCCDICGKYFASSGTLYNHRKRHTYKKQCEQCDKSFPSKIAYENHVQCDHVGRRFVCGVCGHIYRHKHHIKNHLLKSHPNEGNNSDNYKEIFLTEAEREKKQKEKNKLVDLICSICEKVCKTKRQLYNHRNWHKQNKEDLICQYCSKTYVNKTSLRDHVDSVHLKKKHLCHECGKEYSSKTTLHEHLLIHKGTPRTHLRKKSYKKKTVVMCEHCPSTFGNMTCLKRHVDTVHLGITINCPDCGKEFANSVSMWKHKKSHLTSQYNFCSICSLTFLKQEAYDKHVNSIHDSSRPFACDHCHSFFKHYSNLSDHKRKVHSKLEVVYKRRNGSGRFKVAKDTSVLIQI